MKSFTVLLSLFSSINVCQAAAPKSAFISSLIESAEAKIKASPSLPAGYSDLAFAWTRRARETEDPKDLSRAEEAILAALKRDPSNFDARKVRVIVRIEQGRWDDAAEEAIALNKQTPDDNLIYGLLADARLAQGKYREAESLTQRMLDLRQVNGPGLQRAAQVREIIGYPEGAAEFWTSALHLASSSDAEERAFLLVKLAGLSRREGRLDAALRYLADALLLEPAYPAALIEQARICLDQRKPEEALLALSERLQQSDNLTARYFLIQALQSLNRPDAAEVEGKRFLSGARAVTGGPGNVDDLLIRYLTATSPPDAVKLGNAAAARGHNLEVGDAYAMALLAAGQADAAGKQIERTLEPGVKNPSYFLHAAQIRRAMRDPEGAASYYRKCIEVNANSASATLALAGLQEMRGGAPGR